MKIVIAPDSFKGSCSAKEVADAIAKGIKNAFPQAEIIKAPVADGGEGTMETLVEATNGHTVECLVKDPLGNRITASYGILGDGKTCVVEVASASGLHLVPPEKRNPYTTSSYGTGELIKQALDDGYRTFIIGLGGSATNDGGAGILQALGIKFFDDEGKEITGAGGELGKIASIHTENFDPRIKDCKFIIASDVDNPLVGEKGASVVFGPQKGATAEMVQQLDKNLSHFANKIEEVTGISLHQLKGAGAAGGIGGAFQAFFPSERRKGIDVVLEYICFEEKLKGADLVITGEGQVDYQTAFGKTPMGIAERAQKAHVPTVILAGSVGKNIEALYSYGVIGVYSIIDRPLTLEEAMQETKTLLEKTAEQVVRTYFFNRLQ